VGAWGRREGSRAGGDGDGGRRGGGQMTAAAKPELLRARVEEAAGAASQRVLQGLPQDARTAERRKAGKYYDLKWVKRMVPIGEVAEALGVQRRGRTQALCPFHPDRNPSMSFFRNRFRCHAATCEKGGDVLDLAASFLGGTRPALEWLSRRYPIPELNPEHRRGRGWQFGRVGAGGYGADVVVQSGLLSALGDDAARVLFAASGLADPTEATFTISRVGLAERAGIGRQQAAKARLQLRAVGVLDWERAEPMAGFRSVLRYRLMLDASTCADAVEKTVEKFPKKVYARGAKGRFLKPPTRLTRPTSVPAKSPERPWSVLGITQGIPPLLSSDGGGDDASPAAAAVQNWKTQPAAPRRRRRMLTRPLFDRTFD